MKAKYPNSYGRQLIRTAKEMGWEYSLSGKGHLKFRLNGQMVIAPSTPRDGDAALRKTLAKLRLKAGQGTEQ